MVVIVIVAVSLPPLLLAVTVNGVEGVRVVGVPEIAPVSVEKERPAGSAGAIDQEVTAPPSAEGVTSAISTPFVSVNGLPL